MVRFMPGRRTVDKEGAFFVIFLTLIGAVEIIGILPDLATREKVQPSTRGAWTRERKRQSGHRRDEVVFISTILTEDAFVNMHADNGNNHHTDNYRRPKRREQPER
jgi:hypothetical protein